MCPPAAALPVCLTANPFSPEPPNLRPELAIQLKVSWPRKSKRLLRGALFQAVISPLIFFIFSMRPFELVTVNPFHLSP